MTSYKVEENDKRTFVFSQTHSNKAETDLKIPKALSNRVFKTVTFFEYDLGDKVEENDKRTCLKKKFFSQTHSNKAGNGFENSKGA